MSSFRDSGYDSISDYISYDEEPEGDYQILRTYKTPTQNIALVSYNGDFLIYSNGYVMFSTAPDEDRYSEVIAHVPMVAARKRKRVLIIGGGGGVTTREVLRYKDVEKVVTLDIDEEMVNFGKKLKPMVQFNNGSLNNPKVKTVIEDGRGFLEKNSAKWDVIIVDLPEPIGKFTQLSRLYSKEFYSLLKNRLEPGGAISIACSNGDSTAEYLWSIYETLRIVGFNVQPYHNFEADDGEDWLFCLATTSNININNFNMLVKAKYLSTKELREMFSLPFYYKISKNIGNVQTDQNTVLVDITNRVF
ncbi:spermidine synthase [Bacillus sp. JJ1562]|uniref:spermidine synthase n=1 Tax=Bacillus sp. JJ1562 TaxID=3122960 RepID=UPI003001B7E2